MPPLVIGSACGLRMLDQRPPPCHRYPTSRPGSPFCGSCWPMTRIGVPPGRRVSQGASANTARALRIGDPCRRQRGPRWRTYSGRSRAAESRRWRSGRRPSRTVGPRSAWSGRARSWNRLSATRTWGCSSWPTAPLPSPGSAVPIRCPGQCRHHRRIRSCWSGRCASGCLTPSERQRRRSLLPKRASVSR